MNVGVVVEGEPSEDGGRDTYILYSAHTTQSRETTPFNSRTTVMLKLSASGPGVSVARVERVTIVFNQFDRVRWFVDTTRAAEASFPYYTLFAQGQHRLGNCAQEAHLGLS